MSEPAKDPHVETAGTQGKSILANPEKPESPETGYSAKIIEYGHGYLLWVLRARGSELYVLRPAKRDATSGAYYPQEQIYQFSDLQLAKEAAAKIKGVIEQ
jgi:hypothetical protein